MNKISTSLKIEDIKPIHKALPKIIKENFLKDNIPLSDYIGQFSKELVKHIKNTLLGIKSINKNNNYQSNISIKINYIDFISYSYMQEYKNIFLYFLLSEYNVKSPQYKGVKITKDNYESILKNQQDKFLYFIFHKITKPESSSVLYFDLVYHLVTNNINNIDNYHPDVIKEIIITS